MNVTVNCKNTSILPPIKIYRRLTNSGLKEAKEYIFSKISRDRNEGIIPFSFNVDTNLSLEEIKGINEPDITIVPNPNPIPNLEFNILVYENYTSFSVKGVEISTTMKMNNKDAQKFFAFIMETFT